MINMTNVEYIDYRENDENVAQNLAGPPLAVVCSEAIL